MSSTFLMDRYLYEMICTTGLDSAKSNEKIMMSIVPIKMYEYMVAGKPVLTTRLPGLMKEFGETNGVLSVNSPDAVIDKALELIETRRISSVGEKAQDFVRPLKWDRLTDTFLETLRREMRVHKEQGSLAALYLAKACDSMSDCMIGSAKKGRIDDFMQKTERSISIKPGVIYAYCQPGSFHISGIVMS